MLKHFLHFKLRSQLVIIMITMLIMFAWSLTYLQGVTEEKMLDLIEGQVNSMTKAIEISIEQIYAAGSTDEARFKNFVDHLQKQGVEEVSILSKQQEVVLRSNPQMVGTRLSVSKNEFLIQEKIGTDNRLKTKKIYNTFVPIISKGELEGYIQVSLYFEDLEKLSREMLVERIVWALLVVGIGLILCIFISYWYTKPIPVLIEAIHSITQGEMPRLPAILQADISDLSDSVSSLFKKLQAQKKMEEPKTHPPRRGFVFGSYPH